MERRRFRSLGVAFVAVRFQVRGNLGLQRRYKHPAGSLAGDRLCLCKLVTIGARADGTEELIAVEDGYREGADSWKTVLRDLKRRGMRAPMVAVGAGALGFWVAVRDVWPKTRAQRDWFTSSATSSTNCRSRCSRAGRPPCTRSCTLTTARMPATRSRGSAPITGQVPEGRHDPGTGRRRAASSTSPPSTGTIRGPRR
jgi:hypothetical protein